MFREYAYGVGVITWFLTVLTYWVDVQAVRIGGN